MNRAACRSRFSSPWRARLEARSGLRGVGAGLPLTRIAGMGHRLLASLLAFVLFWSGVGTIEGLPSLTHPFAAQLAVIAPGSGAPEEHKGSVEDHHLDDMPGQPVSEPPLDSPALLQASPPLRLGLDAAPRRQSPAGVLRAPPCLAGPLRPPCGTASLA